MSATVSYVTLALSIEKGSDSYVTLRGSGFVKSRPHATPPVVGTLVTIQYPSTGVPKLQWTGNVHKVSAAGTAAEVRVTQQLVVGAVGRPLDTTDAVTITVDSGPSTATAPADIYSE